MFFFLLPPLVPEQHMNLNRLECVDSRGFDVAKGRGGNCFILFFFVPPLLRCPAAERSLMFPDLKRAERTRWSGKTFPDNRVAATLIVQQQHLFPIPPKLTLLFDAEPKLER